MVVMNKDGNRMVSVAPMTSSASSVCTVAIKAIKSEVSGLLCRFSRGKKGVCKGETGQFPII